MMFFVGENRRGSVFAESCGRGEAAGSGADDDGVVDEWEERIVFLGGYWAIGSC